MIFIFKHVQFNGQNLSELSEKMSLNPRFLVKSEKICFFEEIWF